MPSGGARCTFRSLARRLLVPPGDGSDGPLPDPGNTSMDIDSFKNKAIGWLQEKRTGKVIADYGHISKDVMGLDVSATLRQRANQNYYLVFKWTGRKQLIWNEIELNPSVILKLESAIRDAKLRIGDSSIF